MNIIKVKNDIENDYAGKYLLSIHGDIEKCISLEDARLYWNLEKDPTAYEGEWISLNEDEVDQEATSIANSVAKYIYANEHIIESEIPLDELKKFRSWLAHSLLDLEGADISDEIEYGLDVKTMLNYYDNDMYDEVIKIFSSLSPYINTVNLSSSMQNKCGCSSTSNVSMMNQLLTNAAKMSTIDLSNITVSTCDVVVMYRRYIYNCMVDTFREISFWEDKKIVVEQAIKYIDGILKNNLPLYTSDYLTTFADCDCLANSNYSQLDLQELLKRLKLSFEYIVNDEIKEHKNFISTTLYEWSSKLYERMRW